MREREREREEEELTHSDPSTWYSRPFLVGRCVRSDETSVYLNGPQEVEGVI